MRRLLLITLAAALASVAAIAWTCAAGRGVEPEVGAAPNPSAGGTTHPPAEARSALEPNEAATTDSLRRSLASLGIEARLSTGAPAAYVPIAVFAGRGTERRRIWSGHANHAGSIDVPAAALGAEPGRYAVLAIPTELPVEAPVPDELPASLSLTAPPTGTLHVMLQDEHGLRSDRRWRVCVRALEPGERLGAHPDPARTWDLCKVAEHQVHFHYVGKFSRLMVWIEDPETARPTTAPACPVYVAGPTPDRLLHLRVGPDGRIHTPRLSGSAVDRHGSVVADAILAANVRGTDAAGRATPAFTDADGRFDLTIAMHRAWIRASPNELWLELVGTTGAATRLIPDLEPGGARELGTFVLGERTGICGGTIRDTDGNPIAGARCSIERRRTSGDREYWMPMFSTRTQSFADGSFQVPGAAEGELRLRIYKNGYGRPLPIPLGAKRHDLSIILEHPAHVEACVAERDIDVPSVEFTLHRLDAKGERVEESRTRPDEDGYYTWRGLAPGTYDCVVSRFSSVLHEICGIVLVAGKNAPPRLQDVPVRGRAGIVEIRLVRPRHDSASAKFGLEVVHVETGRKLQPAFAIDDPSTIFLSIEEPSKLIRFEARGYAPLELDCSVHRIEAHLVPAD